MGDNLHLNPDSSLQFVIDVGDAKDCNFRLFQMKVTAVRNDNHLGISSFVFSNTGKGDQKRS